MKSHGWLGALLLAAAISVAPLQQACAAGRAAMGGPQISVIAPAPGSIGEILSLDVSFRGSPVDTVELYMDNALVAKRQLDTPQSRGVISFRLETALLTEGDHDLTVRAWGGDGKPGVTTARVRIPGADLSAPVRVSYPANGIMVAGIVPVRVQLDPELQRQRPYVSFFVDKELKVLRNYPPYEYSWDTTTYPNGWHMLESWAQAPDALTPFKARPVNVNVNNISGETKRQTDVEDLRATVKRPKPIVMAPRVDPSVSDARSLADVDAGSAPAVAMGPHSAASAAEGALSEPSDAGLGVQSAPTSTGVAEGSVAAKLPRLSPKMMGGAAIQPNARLRTASAQPARNAVLPGLDFSSQSRGVPAGSAGLAMVKVQPGDTLTSLGARAGLRPTEIARLNNMAPTAKLAPGRSLVVPRVGAFDVAFDGTAIAFDVAPRVVAGVHLAPIRQIFEHTGGRLYWNGGHAQTVKAVNSTREIELKIGSANATVNNRSVAMDHKAFVESGRTIVPLSFIRDALSVRLNLSRTDGRILLQTR
jgi:LysM repeat protein